MGHTTFQLITMQLKQVFILLLFDIIKDFISNPLLSGYIRRQKNGDGYFMGHLLMSTCKKNAGNVGHTNGSFDVF